MIEQLQLVMSDNLPLRDAVFNTLRDAILKGNLQPGQHLMEMQLAMQLGVSRTPVREAIRKLELEGLVIMVPRKGARVAAISEKSLRDVLEVRRALEELSVTLACKRMDKATINELREIDHTFYQECQSNDVVKIAQIDEEFHQTIYQAADNARLLQMLNQLQNQMYRYRVEYIKNTERRKFLYKEHETLIQKLEERDIPKATETIHQHVLHQEHYVLEVIKQSDN
jgi:DNA-binding GntR family transcriptional regulator